MPANTTRAGLPYPIGTDPVADGDDAIKNLAERLDGTSGTVPSVPYAIAAGTTPGPSFSNVATSTFAVTFPVGRFTQRPIISASVTNAAPSNIYALRLTGITTGGFTVNATFAAPATASVTVDWLAVQMTSTSGGG
jgi:hypothetical protein